MENQTKKPRQDIDFGSLEDLSIKSKEDLERIKLAEEIIALHQNKASQIKEGMQVFILPIAILISSAVATLIINDHTDKVHLANSQIDRARSRIDFMTDKYNLINSLDSQMVMAYKISGFEYYFKPPDEYIEEIKIHYRDLYYRMDSLRKQGIASSKKVAETPSVLNTVSITTSLNSDDKKLIELQNEKLRGNRLADIRIKSLTDSAVNSASKLPDQIKDAVKDMSIISNNISEQAKVSTTPQTNYNIEKDYGVAWFKPGYFLQFDDVRIYFDSFMDKNSGIRINICQSVTEQCPGTPVPILLDNTIKKSFGNANYQITLKAIDHAGHNPFKLAAYIDVVKIAR